ncbi:MAG: phosphatidylserine/phosphatidylglycerophosphate/cardiolipin synthase-like enzyme [Myxococcota bacterium]|jgi:phosphatidylserine/phosphatidylglycerophosphate/cardiolipin synthase-like enzyme
MKTRLILLGAMALWIPTACDDGATPEGDGEFENALSGKADGGFSPCLLDGTVLWLNDATTDLAALKSAGVHMQAAKNLIVFKAGDDGALGTEDDQVFRSATDVDNVSYVGPKAMAQLTRVHAERCVGPYPAAQIIMSPQLYDDSHIKAAEALIDGASSSIDVAMYSYRVSSVTDALKRAVERGVAVRMILESAGDDRKNPEKSTSGRVEGAGIDVRYVNRIMHHKFLIVDGPQDSLVDALGTTLLTGSANLSTSAATRYDENTAILSGVPELALRFQQEFNLLWANSRDFVWVDTFSPVYTMAIPDAVVLDSPYVDVAFTSANFRTYESATFGPTFSVVRGRNAVSDTIVDLIWGAKDSIWIASGHLRSRPVAEALLQRLLLEPELDVRVYLDGQEYISAGTQNYQEAELQECLDKAVGSSTRTEDCYDKGFYYSYELHIAGADLRFKHYSYRWHYSYAPQMHHKYVILDGERVGTGSYNLSDNAEHNTMENFVVYEGAQFPALVDDFVRNHEALSQTGIEAKLYDTLIDDIESGSDPVPIVYDAMALTWPQVTTLKELIRNTCSDIDTEDFRRHPEAHLTCTRK